MRSSAEVSVLPTVSDAVPTTSVPRRPRVRVQPAGRWPTINLGELWAYRGLLYFLVWRDIKVRYVQTVLGTGWAILQPVVAHESTWQRGPAAASGAALTVGAPR
jgi:hypothetical protein